MKLSVLAIVQYYNPQKVATMYTNFFGTKLLSIFNEEPENTAASAGKADSIENPPVNKRPRMSLSLKFCW